VEHRAGRNRSGGTSSRLDLTARGTGLAVVTVAAPVPAPHADFGRKAAFALTKDMRISYLGHAVKT